MDIQAAAVLRDGSRFFTIPFYFGCIGQSMDTVSPRQLQLVFFRVLRNAIAV